ncbi:flagellar biosynthesis anti-sigma factor FlgM [Mangrovibacter yixingensis]|uniref:flagellar biosynthesis anti-sigma factor FlgM n=1 Tax=Mangrovibacter yixingensis TaxID=1529639 RepID=UPI001CFC5644|nr:flagellar biosynthesis anti-sigma factor FlgM [Mangrovibacter yixingensis]
MMKITGSQPLVTRQMTESLPTKAAGHEERITEVLPLAAANEPVPEAALAALKSMPEVDLARVAEMKAAIANGEVSIDLDALSQAMRRFHQGGQ